MKGLTYLLVLAILVSFISVAAQDENTTVNQSIVPSVVCTQTQCDSACMKCSDHQCHEPDFRCVEEVTLDKFFPAQVNLGVTQLNIVLKNTGTVDLDDIYAVVTGDGIETIDKIPLDKLSSGSRDYVFAKINASKTGTIDIVIKLYVAGNVRYKYVDQIEVLEAPKPTTEQINVTGLTNALDQFKQQYKTLEQEYQDKRDQGYTVDLTYDKLREVSSYIIETQSALFELNYKKVQANLAIIKDGLSDITSQLQNAKQKQQTFKDKLRNNLLLIGSLAAAIVSIFTAYKLIQGSVDKEKLLALHKKLMTSRKQKATKTRNKRKKLGKKIALESATND